MKSLTQAARALKGSRSIFRKTPLEEMVYLLLESYRKSRNLIWGVGNLKGIKNGRILICIGTDEQLIPLLTEAEKQREKKEKEKK